MVAPFVLLLGAIAVLPLDSRDEPLVGRQPAPFLRGRRIGGDHVGLLFVAARAPVQAHWPAPHVALPSDAGLNVAQTGEVLANAILGEYIPFIVLLFSLYTISGGIRIEGDLPAHPLTNCAFLAAGAVLASFIGTTGAAMLLIRPLLETNRERKHVQHTVIFFIFIVCNCGGLLLPLGDPPLFLGYLMGVPFLWTLVLWKEWLFVNGALLVIYYVWDHFWCYPHERRADRRPRRDPRPPAAVWRALAQRLAVGRRDSFGGVARSRQADARHRLASVALPAGSRAVGAGGACRWRWAAATCGGRTASTMPRSWRWPCCSSASSSACSRHCKSWPSRGRTWG